MVIIKIRVMCRVCTVGHCVDNWKSIFRGREVECREIKAFYVLLLEQFR